MNIIIGKNPKGTFQVTGTRNGKWVVTYDKDGSIALMDPKIGEQFITNDLQNFTPDYNTVKGGYFKALGYLAKHGFLSVDIHPNYHYRFEKMYFSITGKYPNKGVGCYPHNGEKSHEHIRFKVVFPNTLSVNFNPYKVLDVPNRKVIYSMELGINLLKLGFNLGRNQKITEILLSVPSEFRTDFLNGYSL
jgi:hypothetical protein